MMNRQTYGYLYTCLVGRRAFLVILSVLLVSCSATKKNQEVETQQVQPELKQQQIHDENRSMKGEIQQQKKSNQTNKQADDSLRTNDQKQTNASNYSSEIKNAQTSQEKAALTEDKLNASLRDFDEMLLKKNEELSQISKRDGEFTGSGSANQGGTKSGEGEHTGGGRVSASRGSGQSVAGVKSEDKNIDNDDVIARQIREAAEKETDPELKKKLWIEYEKYKAGSK